MNDAPLRVLVAEASWPRDGGTERLVNGLASRGLDITLWPPRRSGPRGGAGRRARGADVIFVPSLDVAAAQLDLFASVPVVVSCLRDPATVAVSTPSSPGGTDRIAQTFALARRVHVPFADILDAAAASGLDPAKASVVPPDTAWVAVGSAVDRRPPRDGTCRVLSTGPLTWFNGIEHAIRAVHQSVSAGVDVAYDIIGDGPDLDHLRFAIDDLGLHGRVRLLGTRSEPEVLSRMAAADVFLRSSCDAGLSGDVMDAMAHGLPVVSTDTVAARETIRHGVDGLLVPVRGTDDAAEALALLAADAGLRRRLGTSARQRIAGSFGTEARVTAFVRLLGDAANGRAATTRGAARS